jgi:hypothetical protein
MTKNANLTYDKLAVGSGMPEWVRSERYEYCEDFCENYAEGKEGGLWAKLASLLTALFI